MGINTNDPNYVQNMMDDPNVQNQINGLLQNPQVIDQIVSRLLSRSSARVTHRAD